MGNVKVDSVTIDGADYVRADLVGVDRSDSPVRIVVGQRGWVWVGYPSNEGEHIRLSGARCIRTWGTTRGLGELVDGPTDSTKLDPAGDVLIHELAVVASIAVDSDAWKAHLG